VVFTPAEFKRLYRQKGNAHDRRTSSRPAGGVNLRWVLVVYHQHLVNEATRVGAEEILRHMPAEHSPLLEQAIRQGVRQAVLYYAAELDTLSRELRFLQHGRRRL